MITVTLVKYPSPWVLRNCCVVRSENSAFWCLLSFSNWLCISVCLSVCLSLSMSVLARYLFIHLFILCCCCCRLIPSWTWRKQQVCLYTRHLPLCQSVGPSVWTIVVCQSVCLQFLVTTSERLSPCVFSSFAKFACSKLRVIICFL